MRKIITLLLIITSITSFSQTLQKKWRTSASDSVVISTGSDITITGDFITKESVKTDTLKLYDADDEGYAYIYSNEFDIHVQESDRNLYASLLARFIKFKLNNSSTPITLGYSTGGLELSEVPFVITKNVNDSITISADASSSTIQSNNPINIDTDSATFYGQVVTTDTLWDDLKFAASRLRQGATLKPDFDTDSVGLLFPSSDSSEIVYINAQMPHRWKYGSTIAPHIHWSQWSSDTVIFRMKYRVYPVGGAIPQTWQYATTTKAQTVPYTSGIMHQIAAFDTISMVGGRESTMLDILIYRIDYSTGGTLSGDVTVKEFDIHFMVDKLGNKEDYLD